MHTSTEKHYTAIEVGHMWGISTDLARDLFRDEPGVLRIERPETRRKRGYLTIRIPQSVVDRVHVKLTAARH
jgi:hypothetical protein